MLLEMSMKMGSKHIANDVREMAARRSNRQQQRILLQITVVALIFYAYMTAYYVSYYSRFQSIAVMIFNSYFYSITHMINPVIYFSLNKEMRAQLREAFVDFRKLFSCKKKDPYGFANSSTKINHSTKVTMVRAQSTSCSETSPLFSSNNHYKSTCPTQKTEERSLDSLGSSTGNESAEIRAIVQNDDPSDQCSLPKSDIYMTPPVELPTNKMGAKERSTFINQLVSALQYASNKSLSSIKNQNGIVLEEIDEAGRKREEFQPVLRKLDKSATTNDISSMIKQRYIRFSNTLQVISRDSIDNLMPENHKYISMGSLERSCLLNDMSGISDSTSNTIQKSVSRSQSSSIFHGSTTNCNGDTGLLLDDEDIDTDNEEEIAYL